MKTTIFLILVLAAAVAGQVKFQIKNVPGNFAVRFDIAACDTTGLCSGDATFTVRGMGRRRLNQEFKLPTEFRLWDEKQKPGSAIPYLKQGIVTLEDFNFDGLPDLAIQNGMDSGYGGASYNIYLYSTAKKEFVLSDKFSQLATAPYLGRFSINRKRMILRTDQKSGCCWHEVQEFKVVKNDPVMIYQSVENASGRTWVVTTTRRFVNGKWTTKVSKVRKRG